MEYYVQNFQYDGPGESLCYGAMNNHNHDESNQFSKDIIAYLTAQGAKNIRPGNFRSHQSIPRNGKEFNWNGNNWVKS
ncbi:hypothetical protein [Tenacibaculum geojense]|uniref:Uncharacterized protein n=1 Tax=Tenacibaculum geojense TaxID=915352 RepID=A0ABW3JNG3_9FLAO